jgi:hypothetical protein
MRMESSFGGGNVTCMKNWATLKGDAKLEPVLCIHLQARGRKRFGITRNK